MKSDLWDKHYSAEMTVRHNRPVLSREIKIPYLFGEKQTLNLAFRRIRINDPDREEFLGHTECGLGQLVHLGSVSMQITLVQLVAKLDRTLIASSTLPLSDQKLTLASAVIQIAYALISGATLIFAKHFEYISDEVETRE